MEHGPGDLRSSTWTKLAVGRVKARQELHRGSGRGFPVKCTTKHKALLLPTSTSSFPVFSAGGSVPVGDDAQDTLQTVVTYCLSLDYIL